MKIAFYINKSVYGGGQRVLITLVIEFVKRNIDTIVYTRQKEFDKNVVPCKINFIDTSVNPFLQIVRLANDLKKEKVGKIIVFGCDTVIFAATKIANVKYVYSLRVDPLQINFKKFTYKYIINHCHKIVFQTRKVQNYFKESIKRKSCVIPNPILDENLPDIQTNRQKKIVLVARLSEEKNIEMAIRAFAKTHNNDFKFHIYGVGEQMDYLKKLTHDLNMNHKVVFEGYVSRVIDYIKDAEILLLTSNFEGMPNALIEGMSMGLACISTDFPSGAAHDLIDNGVNGIIVPMNDVDCLADKLQYLIDNPDERRSIQSAAIEIRQKQNIDIIVDRWINFIKD